MLTFERSRGLFVFSPVLYSLYNLHTKALFIFPLKALFGDFLDLAPLNKPKTADFNRRELSGFYPFAQCWQRYAQNRLYLWQLVKALRIYLHFVFTSFLNRSRRSGRGFFRFYYIAFICFCQCLTTLICCYFILISHNCYYAKLEFFRKIATNGYIMRFYGTCAELQKHAIRKLC